MTTLREAAQQALEALDSDNPDAQLRAAIALRAALAEPVQEPVAWMYHGIRHDDTLHDRPSLIWRPEYMDAMSAEKGAKATPLYTDPPQRQPLTYPQLHELDWPDGVAFEEILLFARAIEAAHGIKEKNK
jgi:hypothetical protein